MIIGDDRRAVIENIKRCAESGLFHEKVELNDPVLDAEERRAITDKYLINRTRPFFRLKTAVGVAAARIATRLINKDTRIVGIEKIPKDIGGMIITSNHFSPLENTVIRHLVEKLGRRRLAIISQTTNFAMKGPVGFLMNYADTVPINTDSHYLVRSLPALMDERIRKKGDAMLIYPEQEMWFNYRKPRPPMEGAYYFAARLGVPIVSCFVEIVDLEEDDTPEFKRVRYVLHVLDVLYPDPSVNVRENTSLLAKRDYDLKRECYERVYGRPLTYDFDKSDIAGWKGTL